MIDLIDLVRSIAAEAARAEENTNHPLPCTPGSPLLASVRQACVERGFTASGEGEPAAAPQVVADERTLFEASEPEMNLARDAEGEYENPCVASGWKSWQDRAALAAAPVQAQEPFAYMIVDESGEAYFGEFCVASGKTDLEAELEGLNYGQDGKPYKIVPVFRAPVQPVAVPAGWCQFIDGVKTQNVARDTEELGTIKSIFKVMAPAGAQAEYRPFYFAAPAAQGDAKDAERLEFIENGTFDLRCYNDHDDDVYWNVIEHHMAAPIEREIGWGNTARQAIDAAIAAKAVKS
ncbi:hypothetical protein CLU92_5449 [Janthinobacterium sp. 61]|uniref:hypothetical protein n=1 Tax=Janthinobacterium sp. 61 TaxID=2035209 RepID=UPI000CA6B7F0|nr:hypothetical protein [Janthinobacterium sp. 61]PKV47974.1 hypothetical protein CLU92_5449 [Janthinobacterium sp. 61]